MSRKLVAYFSASGVTGRVAKALAEAANADLYEIKPRIPYTTADLNWMDKKSRSTIEMQDKASRPAMADYDAPVADADVIFATSGGSDFGRTLEALEDSVRCTAHLMEGKILNGKQTKEELTDWVKSLKIRL